MPQGKCSIEIAATAQTVFDLIHDYEIRFGKVAAVKMTNRPLFFERFAATIRHDDLENGRSRVTYIYSFASKPRWLSLFQEPIMKLCLTREVKHRLRALKAFAEAKTENS